MTPTTPQTPQEGENAFGLRNIGCCSRYSYSGTFLARGVNLNAAHVNGRHPVRGMGQELIYLMTCSPLSYPEDLKPMIHAAIKAITPPEESEEDYVSLKFSLANGE